MRASAHAEAQAWLISCGVIGALAITLNILVLIFILHKGLRKGPNADLFIFSLAFADLTWAIQPVIIALVKNQVITPGPKHLIHLDYSIKFSAGMSIVSSLFHMVAITTDRLLAIIFPLRHRSLVTRKRVYVIIGFIWVISVTASSSQFWSENRWSFHIIDWVQTFGNLIGCWCFVVTYSYICVISVKRRKVLRSLTCNQTRKPQNTFKINTTVLSVCIISAFMICNLPHSIAKIALPNDSEWSVHLTGSILFLLTMNTVLDPMLYTMAGLISRIMTSRMADNQSGADRTESGAVTLVEQDGPRCCSTLISSRMDVSHNFRETKFDLK